MNYVLDGVTSKVTLQGDALVSETIQDCTPYLDDAVARHNEGLHGSSEMKHAARIPNVIVEKYCNDNGITFQEFMNGREHIKRMLNDPSLSYFRIWKGKV